jgi:hypothetical protein
MAYSKQKMSIDTRSCTRKFSQPVDSNAENELVCVCGSQTQVWRHLAEHPRRFGADKTGAIVEPSWGGLASNTALS